MQAQVTLQIQMQQRQMQQLQMMRQIQMQQRQAQLQRQMVAARQPPAPPRVHTMVNTNVRRIVATRTAIVPTVRRIQPVAPSRAFAVRRTPAVAQRAPNISRPIPQTQVQRINQLRAMTQPRRVVTTQVRQVTQVRRVTTTTPRPAVAPRRAMVAQRRPDLNKIAQEKVTARRVTQTEHTARMQLQVKLRGQCTSCHNCPKSNPGLAKLPPIRNQGLARVPERRPPALVLQPPRGPGVIQQPRAPLPPPRIVDQRRLIPPVVAPVRGLAAVQPTLPPIGPLGGLAVKPSQPSKKPDEKLASLGDASPPRKKPAPSRHEPPPPGKMDTPPSLPSLDTGRLQALSWIVLPRAQETRVAEALLPSRLGSAPEIPPLAVTGPGRLPPRGLEYDFDLPSDSPLVYLVARAPAIPPLPQGSTP
jgi:hypothetical protein